MEEHLVFETISVNIFSLLGTIAAEVKSTSILGQTHPQGLIFIHIKATLHS